MSYHWPHWVEAIEWIAENYGYNIVLTGQLTSSADPNYKFPWIEHPKITNFVGQTQTMVDVLHIANWSKGIVTTSNGLSMWSIIKNKPAFVACHRILESHGKHYSQWIRHEPNKILETEATLDRFKEEFNLWISGLKE